MSVKNVLRYLLITIVALGLLLYLNLTPKTAIPAKADAIFRLQAPPLVTASDIQGIIESEAGISAWFHTPSTINLNNVRGSFRTIEIETADYILGSVPVPNYDESESWDVHVYVHKDGWILAYYLAQDPVGKIYDWKAYHNSGRTTISTKLENVIAVIANAAGFPFSIANATYYDFRYPNATHLMLIVDWLYTTTYRGDSDSFQLKLPSSFAYYQQSWSLAHETDCESAFVKSSYWLNSAKIQELTGYPWEMAHGILSASQLPPDQYHTIKIEAEVHCIYRHIYAYGGLALVYRVP